MEPPGNAPDRPRCGRPGHLITVALVDIRFWWRYSYFLYAACWHCWPRSRCSVPLGGAQRWINLGVIKLQPSELMKVGLVLALARYFHGVLLEDVPGKEPLALVLIALPSAFVLKQPDLGTALFLIMIGGAVFFVAGVRLEIRLVLAVPGPPCQSSGAHFAHTSRDVS